MSKTAIEVPDIGTIFITKKRGQRSMRLRVDARGQIQVSMPWLAPRTQAIRFVKSKLNWIREQQDETAFNPYHGMLFGKTQQLMIRQKSAKVRPEQDGKHLIVHFANTYDPTNMVDVTKVEKAIMRSLRNEAEKILLPRLKELAEMYNCSFASSSIKHVVGRWGSCDSNKHIVLSIFLIQLPIEMIDYVIIHELAHTKHMNHSPEFWATVEEMCPEYKQIRKEMKGLRPKIYDAKAFMA